MSSSKSDGRTIAAASASSSFSAMSRSAASGDAPGMNGWRSCSPRYLVESSMTDRVATRVLESAAGCPAEIAASGLRSDAWNLVMIDRQKLETVLVRRFPGAGPDQIASAANAIMGSWGRVDCRGGVACTMATSRLDAGETRGILEAIFESAIDGIIVVDARGHIEAFNPGAERLFGYTHDEVIGQNVSVLMPSPYRE